MKLIPILIILLFCINISYAYKVNYLGNYNEKECNKIINSIPQEYFKGLKSITFFGYKKDNMAGFYWFASHKIDMYANCDEGIIRHELAHLCQQNKGDSNYNMIHHLGLWDKCYSEVAL